MNPTDVVVICTLGLPISQALDLLSWYCLTNPNAIDHPSIDWWVRNFDSDVWAHYS